ncbi:MAG: hypothetical protein K0Q66_1578 [Chitinophagaceae bacterium]|nr:hypothetical protein [Chitinophagaceae bacterium]
MKTRTRNTLSILAIVIALALAGCFTNSATKTFVSDQEHVLDSLQEDKLNRLYLDHETTSTNQIVLLTTKTFEIDSTIEAYSLRKFNSIGIGQKEKNNGVLIVFSASMRQVRIATGIGTEKVLKDSIAKKIIDSSMTPYFKKEQYFEGLWNGSTAIISFLEKPENKITGANR